MLSGLRRVAGCTLFVGMAAACDSGTPSQPDPPDGALEIRLTTDLRFLPAEITVDPGTTVRWTNDATLFHTITPDDPDQSGVWERAATTSPGPALEHTFEVSGQTYTYHCEPHLAQGMVATIRVR